jgi:hypothetical protein
VTRRYDTTRTRHRQFENHRDNCPVTLGVTVNTGFKISYNEMRYTVMVDKSTGSTAVEGGGQGKTASDQETTRSLDRMERIGHLSIIDLPTLVLPIYTVPVVHSHRVAKELSCGDELPNGFLDRSRWYWPCQEDIL